MEPDKTIIARWATRTGTREIVLFRDAYGYTYRDDDCGGSFPATSDAHAIQTMENCAVAVQRSDFPSTRRIEGDLNPCT